MKRCAADFTALIAILFMTIFNIVGLAAATSETVAEDIYEVGIVT